MAVDCLSSPENSALLPSDVIDFKMMLPAYRLVRLLLESSYQIYMGSR